MFNLLSYGTLRDIDIFNRVSGKEFNQYFYKNIILKDYQTYYVKNQLYPFLKYEKNSFVEITLYKNIEEKVFKRIKNYESLDYNVKEIMVECEYFLYFDYNKSDITDLQWSFEQFLLKEKEKFISKWRKL